MHVHSPVLIESFHSSRKVGVGIFESVVLFGIIDLRPHSRHGLVAKDNSSEGGGKRGDRVDSTRRGLHSIRRLCYSHELLKL